MKSVNGCVAVFRAGRAHARKIGSGHARLASRLHNGNCIGNTGPT